MRLIVRASVGGWAGVLGGMVVSVGAALAWRAPVLRAASSDVPVRVACWLLGVGLVAAGTAAVTGRQVPLLPLSGAVAGALIGYLAAVGPAFAEPGLVLSASGAVAAWALQLLSVTALDRYMPLSGLRRYGLAVHPAGGTAGHGDEGADVEAAAGGVVGRGPLLTVTYTGEPDVMYEFADEGDARVFGRDESVCDIVIWSAINGQDLARAAGRIWRMDGELWLRNLSTTHELRIQVPDLPPDQPLPRRKDQHARGAARSIPGPVCSILAPGGCELRVRQLHQPAPEALTFGLDSPTMARVPDVPASLRPVAAALCEPLLRGGYLPASYREVMARTGEPSLRVMRKQVADLCRHYTDASEELRGRVEQRMRREQRELDIPEHRQLRHGVWSFDRTGTGPDTDDHDDELNRRRALALPDYYEVAVLLVSHYRVTAADVAAVLLRREDA